MQFQTRLFIGGEFVDARDGGTIATLNPHDGSTLAEVAAAGEADIDAAVDAGEKAFPAWRDMAAADRGRLLLRLADAIDAHADELARIESLDTGHPIRDTRGLDVPRTSATFRYFGGMADKLQGSVIPVERGFLNYVTREPLGVVGQIVPWNFPVMFTSWKMAPALAAGNCVVMKPAELTPLSSLKVAELIRDTGFPPGVVNLVAGDGATAGHHLSAHPRLQKIAFTGSTVTGRKIVQASAGNLKRVQLELGGKGANIVFDDADLPAAIGGSAFAVFHNQGQACIAGSRLLLHEKIADRFLDGFLKLAASIRLGNPLDPLTEMGPLTSAAHRERVLNYCKIAREEGGEILLGGKPPDGPALADGYYLAPTVVRARPARPRLPGGSLRAVRHRDDLQGRSRGHRDRKRHRVRPRWRSMDARSAARASRGTRDDHRYGLDQLLQARESRLAIRRRAQFRLRARHGFRGDERIHTPKSVWVNVDAAIPPYYQR